MSFQTLLQKLGLKDKEAAVYLALLELGPSPVQIIARKAKVVRATTYVILEHLMKMGLVTKFEQGKKTMFLAEAPNQLMRVLEKQVEDIKDKEKQLELMLPELQMLMKVAGERPSVRYFEGREGLVTIRREIIMHMKSGDIVYNFTPIDYLYAVFPNEDEYYKQRIAKGIRSKTLFTTKSSKVRKQLVSEVHGKMVERRYMLEKDFSLTSGMTIYRNRIAIGSFTGNFLGAVIESESMANMMRELFNLAWDGASVYQKDIDDIAK